MRALPIAGALLLTTSALWGQGMAPPKSSMAQAKSSLTWGPAPAVFPAGAKMAVVSGDPGKAAPFEVQLSIPDGYRFPPHFHPTDETVQVLKGTFLYGMGDTFDAASLKPMQVGDKGSIPANMHHYAQAKGATLLSVSAMGPFALTYVNPADDPQIKAPKP